MKFHDLEVAAETHFAEFEEYALSVFCVPGCGRDEIAQIAQQPHSVIRESTVEQIREAGYDLVPSPWFGEGHADLKLPTPPSAEDWQRLDEVFSEPVPNVARS